MQILLATGNPSLSCTFLGGSPVIQECKIQDRVFHSSTEAEFWAIAQDVWRTLDENYNVNNPKTKLDIPMQLYYDDKSSI